MIFGVVTMSLGVLLLLMVVAFIHFFTEATPAEFASLDVRIFILTNKPISWSSLNLAIKLALLPIIAGSIASVAYGIVWARSYESKDRRSNKIDHPVRGVPL